jgi:hypothetical protein
MSDSQRSDAERLDRQRTALDRVGSHLAGEIDFWWHTIGDAIGTERLHGHYGRSKIIREILVRHHGAPENLTLRETHDAAMQSQRVVGDAHGGES